MNYIHSWSTSQLDLKYIQRCSNTRGEAIASASGRRELNERNTIVESFHYPYGKYWRWSEVVSQGSKNNRDLPNPGMELGLLHCRQICCHLSQQGRPYLFLYLHLYHISKTYVYIWLIYMYTFNIKG